MENTKLKQAIKTINEELARIKGEFEELNQLYATADENKINILAPDVYLRSFGAFVEARELKKCQEKIYEALYEETGELHNELLERYDKNEFIINTVLAIDETLIDKHLELYDLSKELDRLNSEYESLLYISKQYERHTDTPKQNVGEKMTRHEAIEIVKEYLKDKKERPIQYTSLIKCNGCGITYEMNEMKTFDYPTVGFTRHYCERCVDIIGSISRI